MVLARRMAGAIIGASSEPKPLGSPRFLSVISVRHDTAPDDPARRVRAGRGAATVRPMEPRLRAICDLRVAEVREYAGLHQPYDGVVQDLSPAGVRSGLDALGAGRRPGGYDGDQVEAAEAGLRATFGLVEDHRRKPLRRCRSRCR